MVVKTCPTFKLKSRAPESLAGSILCETGIYFSKSGPYLLKLQTLEYFLNGA